MADKTSFKDFMVGYDQNQDEFIQYRRRKFRRTDTTSEAVEPVDEKKGLWDNIHAKRKRIEKGSGEKMRKPGSEGAPTNADFKRSQKEEVEVDEALNLAQRRRRAMQFRKAKGKIKIGRERAENRVASNDRLMKRARKHARDLLVKKLTKGKSKDELDYARREAIEKRVDKMKNKIDLLAKKLMPQLRKAELSKRQPKDKSK